MGPVVNVVVTGSSGFVGRHVVDRLASDGHRLIAVDRVAPSRAVPPGVIPHVSDLSDPSSLLPASALDGQPFTLVHLAWDLRERETSFAGQAEQVSLFARLLDAWGGRGLRQVVAPGSASEFGARNGRIGDDDPAVPPLSPYGWAKRAAFDLATSWAQRTGAGVLWLRPFIIYGPGQSGGMVVPYAVEQARRGEVAEFTDCNQIRDFVYIDDVAEAFALAVTQRPPGVHAMNLGTGDAVRLRDLLSAIAECFGAEANFRFGARPRRTQEPDEQVADVARATSLLGWRPRVDWREGVRRICHKGGSAA